VLRGPEVSRQAPQPAALPAGGEPAVQPAGGEPSVQPAGGEPAVQPGGGELAAGEPVLDEEAPVLTRVG
jgi:hypothetical protein